MLKLERSTVQLLRLPFSIFLMPVFWFALSQVSPRDWGRALLVFVILHLLVYPASNGYNSYMDRDSTPIGGLEHPLQPTSQLFVLTLGMDILALLLGLLISLYFAAGLLIYILASRAYSYRGIRLKRYPIIGWLTVTACQGALIFFIVYQGSHPLNAGSESLNAPVEAMVASSLLLGGFYPLTQIYQHEADRRDGVKTLSMLLGYRGSFVFTGLIYVAAFLILAWYFLSTLQLTEFKVLATCMVPVVVYFLIWAVKVWRDPARASYVNSIRMNVLGSICLNLGFILVLIIGGL
ncbi:MAG TPA: UbiA family prenyltransferase [Puia sp.]|jgi:1,4-dihydroxy-2-naphthoate octaprenyltransferase|nr:UbiA family prenyltransferase [Puia sp.]